MATDYDGFIATVEREAEVPRDVAERAVTATLATLGERISGGEARDLAEQLPSALRPVIADHADRAPDAFSGQEFLQRVQAREHVPIFQAERHVRAVFAAMRRTVSDDELADLASELPREIEMLLFDEPSPDLAEAPSAGAPASAEEFVDRVARRSGLDEDAARRGIDAVLEMMAFRLAAGEVDDLRGRLPAGLHPPLDRGKAEKPHPSAHWLPLKQFLIAVAEREGVPRSEARLHTRAVFATLAEAVGEDEIGDVMAELPHEYRSLFPRR